MEKYLTLDERPLTLDPRPLTLDLDKAKKSVNVTGFLHLGVGTVYAPSL